jgi:hypothetical protein
MDLAMSGQYARPGGRAAVHLGPEARCLRGEAADPFANSSNGYLEVGGAAEPNVTDYVER